MLSTTLVVVGSQEFGIFLIGVAVVLIALFGARTR